MAITEAFVGSASISTTEYSFPSASTTRVAQTADGAYQVFIDAFAMQAGDRMQFVAYEKVNGSGSTQRAAFPPWILDGTQQCLLVIPTLILLDGWDFTALSLAGSARTIAWSIRKVA